MSRVKSGFIKAGSIIAIVLAGLMAIGGVIFFCSPTLLNHQFYIEEVLEYKAGEYDIIENADGSVTYKLHHKNGDIEVLDGEKVDMQIDLLNKVMIAIGSYLEVASLASLVFAILLLIGDSKGKVGSGLVVGMLTTGILSCNILTAAFMIVALCLKDKQEDKPEVEQAA